MSDEDLTLTLKRALAIPKRSTESQTSSSPAIIPYDSSGSTSEIRYNDTLDDSSRDYGDDNSSLHSVLPASYLDKIASSGLYDQYSTSDNRQRSDVDTSQQYSLSLTDTYRYRVAQSYAPFVQNPAKLSNVSISHNSIAKVPSLASSSTSVSKFTGSTESAEVLSSKGNYYLITSQEESENSIVSISYHRRKEADRRSKNTDTFRSMGAMDESHDNTGQLRPWVPQLTEKKDILKNDPEMFRHRAKMKVQRLVEPSRTEALSDLAELESEDEEVGANNLESKSTEIKAQSVSEEKDRFIQILGIQDRTKLDRETSIERNAILLSCYAHVPKIYGAKPPKLSGHISVLVNGEAYIYGGFDESGKVFNELYIYNCTTSCLRNPKVRFVGKEPPRLSGMSAVLMKNRYIYIFGGTDGKQCKNDLHILDVDTLEWKEVPHTKTGSQRVPEKRRGHSCICDATNKQLYIFGGITDDYQLKNDIWRLDVAQMSNNVFQFHEVLSLDKDTEDLWPQRRAFHSAHVCNGGESMLIYGGIGVDDFQVLSDVWYYKFALRRWEKMEQAICEKFDNDNWQKYAVPCTLSRAFVDSWLLGDSLLVYGGYDGGRLTRNLAVLRLSTRKWQFLPIKGVDFAGQCKFKGVFYDCRLFLIGGESCYDIYSGVRIIEVPLAGTFSSVRGRW